MDVSALEVIKDLSSLATCVIIARGGTAHALNAKDERVKKVDDGSQNKSSREENFTRDGLEALKPFQSVVSEEKTQSS